MVPLSVKRRPSVPSPDLRFWRGMIAVPLSIALWAAIIITVIWLAT